MCDETLSITRETTIRELAKMGVLSVRARNVLVRTNLHTLGDIADYVKKNPDGLQGFRNFGRKSQSEIMDLLTTYVFTQVETCPEHRIPISLPPILDEFVKSLYQSVIEENTPVSNFFGVLHPNYQSLWDAIIDSNNSFLLIHKELGRNGNIELRTIYKRLLSRIESKLAYIHVKDRTKILSLINSKQQALFNSYDRLSSQEIVENFFTPNQYSFLEEKFKELCDKMLSHRARSLQISHLPTLKSILPFLGVSRSSFSDVCPERIMRKSLDELYNLANKLENIILAILPKSKDDLWVDSLKQDFPFLDTSAIEQVVNYHKENDAVPLFLIAYKYLTTSPRRDDKIFCMLNGLYDGKCYTLSQVGMHFKLSGERVRQIFRKKKNFQFSKLDHHTGWAIYKSLFASAYITELSPKFRMIKEEEHLPLGFSAFAKLVPLVANFVEYQIEGKTILCSQCLIDCFDFNTAYKKLEATLNGRYAQDTKICLNDFTKDVNASNLEDAQRLMIYVATELLKLTIDEDGCFTISRNYFDAGSEVYNILNEKGEPMSLISIFREFKKRFPNHHSSDPNKFKFLFVRNEHIKPIGKTSTYGLDTWPNVYFGNIRDLLRETLEASPYPLSLDKLTKIVRKHFKETNAKSIASSMAQESSTNFVIFENGYYGLAKKKYPSRFKLAEDRKRYRFSERFKMLETFISTYRRFPTSSGGETEQSLYRWLENVESDRVEVTATQKIELTAMLQSFRDAHIPENQLEENFLEMCQRYKAYIESEYELPTRRGNPELYEWMYRSKANYNSYTDNRRYYLSELFKYINSLGFNI